MEVRDVTNLYALKLPAEYVKGMRAYFPKISIREITNLYALKVPPDYVKQIRDLGYSDISTREITNFYVLKVQPDYIKKMRESGQSVVPGQHIHVPEIHIPEMNFQVHPIPPVPPVPAVAPFIPENHNTKSWFPIISDIAQASLLLGVLLLRGLGGYYLYKRRFAEVSENNFDTRIADFENRVNDLQDILLSIDDRLDRRLKRT
jgi:hypothetical protein